MLFRLTAALIFLSPGALIGWLFYRFYQRHSKSLLRCLLLGVAGSQCGLWISDLADIKVFDPFPNAIFFSLTGATVLLLTYTLFKHRH